ncbi:MAG TPA: site-2 protease family protein [Candidatus Saccharimonadales bacterium]
MSGEGIDVFYIGIALVTILFSMTLHEVMHGFVAYWLGDDTAKLQGRLTLNPIKHIDPFLTIILPVMLAVLGGPIFGGAKPVPFNPARVRFDEWGSALVALAGPLTNFVIAFFSFVVWFLIGAPVDNIAGLFWLTMVQVNLGFFIFNMIPVPPLDGSRVLYALAPDFVRRGMEAVEQFGIIFVFAIVLVASSSIGVFMGGAIRMIFNFFKLIFGLP